MRMFLQMGLFIISIALTVLFLSYHQLAKWENAKFYAVFIVIITEIPYYV